MLDQLDRVTVRHVRRPPPVDLHDLVTHAHALIERRSATGGDLEHEQRHVVELAAAADGEAETT